MLIGSLPIAAASCSRVRPFALRSSLIRSGVTDVFLCATFFRRCPLTRAPTRISGALWRGMGTMVNRELDESKVMGSVNYVRKRLPGTEREAPSLLTPFSVARYSARTYANRDHAAPITPPEAKPHADGGRRRGEDGRNQPLPDRARDATLPRTRGCPVSVFQGRHHRGADSLPGALRCRRASGFGARAARSCCRSSICLSA